MRNILLLFVISLMACRTPKVSTPKEENKINKNKTSCPASVEGAPGSCQIGDHCEYPTGACDCEGYHGGVPPQPGIDYSHWSCGITKGRTDGCPDNIKEGLACSGPNTYCNGSQGPFCGPLFTCVDGHWKGGRNTCYEIP